ncbi:hypothetical protein ACSBR1_019507 [Camellia fascicularis]
MERKSKGRQKITMTKMENESNLQVTFSKRFLSWDRALNSGTHQLVEAQKSACVRDLNLQLTHVQDLLDVEKQRGTALDQLRMAAGQCEHHWWEGSVGEMNLSQLHQFKAAMIELRTKIGIRTDRIVHERPANPFGYWVGKTSLLVVLEVLDFIQEFFWWCWWCWWLVISGGPNFAGGGVGSPFQASPSFAGGGGGIGVLLFGAGGAGSDNNGIVPFDGRVPDADGSKASYGFNHGIGRGFY